MRVLLALALLATVIAGCTAPKEAKAGIFGRRGGGSCGTSCGSSCGSGSSNGCKISNAPSKAAEAVDLFKEDNTKEEVPQAPPVSAKIRYSKESAVALTSAPQRFDRKSAIALVSAPVRHDFAKSKALLAAK